MAWNLQSRFAWKARWVQYEMKSAINKASTICRQAQQRRCDERHAGDRDCRHRARNEGREQPVGEVGHAIAPPDGDARNGDEPPLEQPEDERGNGKGDEEPEQAVLAHPPS